MTKKDLERRNRFLLLQLKIIAELMEDTIGIGNDELYRKIGEVLHYTNPEKIKYKIQDMEKHDLEYNHLNKEMTISEYE